MSLKANIKGDKLEKKGGSKAKAKDKATPEDESPKEPKPKKQASKKSQPVIWGSPEHKNRRKMSQKATVEEAETDAPDNASEANATVCYDPAPTKPKQHKVMKRAECQEAREAQGGQDPQGGGRSPRRRCQRVCTMRLSSATTP